MAPGITTSEMTRAMAGMFSTMSAASEPFSASTTAQPSSASCMRTTLRTSASSSASSTSLPARSAAATWRPVGRLAWVSASSMRGSSRATVVPRAWRLRMRTPPPDCLVKPYTIDIPRPLPMPNCLVVKKGSKTRARVLPSMPMPLSVTAICT